MTNPAVRNFALVVLAAAAIVWGITLIPGPAKSIPPPLPPHTLVMPHGQFLVDPGYGAFGKVICSEGHYKAAPGGRAFNGKYILSCPDGTHAFSYPKSKVWSYANP